MCAVSYRPFYSYFHITNGLWVLHQLVPYPWCKAEGCTFLQIQLRKLRLGFTLVPINIPQVAVHAIRCYHLQNKIYVRP